MQVNDNHIEQTEEAVVNMAWLDYSSILNMYGIKYTPNSYYWQVGEISKMFGWVIHLSVIKVQLPELLKAILPELTKHTLGFTVIRDYSIAGSIMDGSMGYGIVGKMICIYPVNDKDSLYWAQRLISLTNGFRGPAIPTDRHLGSIVYTNYEDFIPDDIDNTKESQIPFIIPKGINWPFGDIASSKGPTAQKLLNNTYYPLSTIKQDAKGDVIRALYFKKLWQIRFCLIKQGRENMFSDDNERDSRDRLRWQYDLHQKLAGAIPMPIFFKYFEQEGHTYIAMEYIKGQSLSHWIDTAYQNRSWMDMPPRAKLQLLDRLIEIITIIGRMHERGYIHRDITPENFLLDKKGNLYLIDMELSWCVNSKHPDPPFRLGTPGFISPEQFFSKPPTVKEDIYGLGGSMIMFFLNLSPMKFEGMSTDSLRQRLFYFTGKDLVAGLVASCMDPDPAERPELEYIRSQLIQYRDDLQATTIKPWWPEIQIPLNEKAIKPLIQSGLNGLAFPTLTSPKLRWVSRLQRTESHIGNYQMSHGIYTGWHTGMAGPLWIIGLAKNIGFDIEVCQAAYTSSYGYIRESLLHKPDSMMPGLYKGGQGITLAVVEGLNSGLLQPDTDTVDFLFKCLSNNIVQPSLSEGWSGEGIALLYCNNWLKKDQMNPLLKKCIINISESQLPDGSWDLRGDSGKKGDILTGLDRGVAGIIWFLLAYLDTTSSTDENIDKFTRKALAWLIERAKITKGRYTWTISTRSKDIDKWSTGEGMAGIILVFIKAYEIFKEPLYKEIVEGYLKKARPRIVQMDFSLQSGLAGLGELYLEAFRIFEDPVWKERSDWIAGVFINTFQELEPGVGYWLVHPAVMHTADLFSDNSGVLHFLLRHQFPKKVSHPLAPGLI